MAVDDTSDNAGACICPSCPTYNDCMNGKGLHLFCARGKTDCDPTANGCQCGECPVWASYSLGSYYFCMQGAAS